MDILIIVGAIPIHHPVAAADVAGEAPTELAAAAVAEVITYIQEMVEAVLDGANFPCKVSAHWHKGTTLMVKFDEEVIARDRVEGEK